jgi:hypothetical protein
VAIAVTNEPLDSGMKINNYVATDYYKMPTVTNMATIRKFEVTSDKVNVNRICNTFFPQRGH